MNWFKSKNKNFSSIIFSIFVIYLNPLLMAQVNTVEKATFGAGCFWCVEAIYSRVNGVIKVEPGYSGGKFPDPNYKEVCTGTTGHAEVCQITFDTLIISFLDLLEVFWKSHDPTTLNRQGNDFGTQYRSVIFFHNEKQKKEAEAMKSRLDNEKIWDNPIVTEIVKIEKFYVAEDYHFNYYKNNPNQPYCNLVITPKIKKFEATFKEYLINIDK
jgi:peptide-methionine (S)-S-oxide reductase